MFKIKVKKKNVKVKPMDVNKDFAVDYVGSFDSFMWIKNSSQRIGHYRFNPEYNRWDLQEVIGWYEYQTMKKQLEGEI